MDIVINQEHRQQLLIYYLIYQILMYHDELHLKRV